jgi:hypothetical protein
VFRDACRAHRAGVPELDHSFRVGQDHAVAHVLECACGFGTGLGLATASLFRLVQLADAPRHDEEEHKRERDPKSAERAEGDEKLAIRFLLLLFRLVGELLRLGKHHVGGFSETGEPSIDAPLRCENARPVLEAGFIHLPTQLAVDRTAPTCRVGDESVQLWQAVAIRSERVQRVAHAHSGIEVILLDAWIEGQGVSVSERLLLGHLPHERLNVALKRNRLVPIFLVRAAAEPGRHVERDRENRDQHQNDDSAREAELGGDGHLVPGLSGGGRSACRTGEDALTLASSRRNSKKSVENHISSQFATNGKGEDEEAICLSADDSPQVLAGVGICVTAGFAHTGEDSAVTLCRQ